MSYGWYDENETENLRAKCAVLTVADGDLHDTIGRLLKIQSQLQIELASLRADSERLSWLEKHPRLAEIIVDGKSEDCYYYGVAGAPGVPFRAVIDAVMGSEK